jgi:hypothetical protein
MKRRTTEKPLGELDKERNRLISILRSPGERPHAVIKRVFRSRKSVSHYSPKSSHKNDGYGIRFQPLSALYIEKCRNHLNLAEAVKE